MGYKYSYVSNPERVDADHFRVGVISRRGDSEDIVIRVSGLPSGARAAIVGDDDNSDGWKRLHPSYPVWGKMDQHHGRIVVDLRSGYGVFNDALVTSPALWLYFGKARVSTLKLFKELFA